METWVVTLIAACIGAFAGIIGGIVGAFCNQWLQARNRRNQFVQEGALARYAEFVAIASAEEQRAETISILAPHAYTVQSRQQLHDLDQQRHPHRRDLQRIAWQIQLLERNQELRTLLQRLVDEQPFEMILLVATDRHTDQYIAAEDRYRKAWLNYEQMLTRLVCLVQEVHLNVRPPANQQPTTAHSL